MESNRKVWETDMGATDDEVASLEMWAKVGKWSARSFLGACMGLSILGASLLPSGLDMLAAASLGVFWYCVCQVEI